MQTFPMNYIFLRVMPTFLVMLSNQTYYLMCTHTHTYTVYTQQAHVNTSIHRLEQNAQNSTHIPVHGSLPNFMCGILIPVDTVPDQLRVLSASSTGLPTKCVPANGAVLVSVWKLVGVSLMIFVPYLLWLV